MGKRMRKRVSYGGTEDEEAEHIEQREGIYGPTLEERPLDRPR
jgi:hypothetical protein